MKFSWILKKCHKWNSPFTSSVGARSPCNRGEIMLCSIAGIWECAIDVYDWRWFRGGSNSFDLPRPPPETLVYQDSLRIFYLFFHSANFSQNLRVGWEILLIILLIILLRCCPTPRPSLCHCLKGYKCAPITYVWNVPIQSHVSTLACILSMIQEFDVTWGDIKEVNQPITVLVFWYWQALLGWSVVVAGLWGSVDNKVEFCLGRPDCPLYNTTWYDNRFQARPLHHSSLVWARPSIEAEKRLLIIFPILNLIFGYH
jgi:hypothetical protein